MLVGALGFFSTHTGTAHAAAVTLPPLSSSVAQIGNPAGYHPTATEKAYAADKKLLSEEYGRQVLSGHETLADFEVHYRAFMLKWHLGNVSNLHSVLTRSTSRLRANVTRLAGAACPSLATGPAVLCPVNAAQFPEESFNWCGPATLATTVVENSFTWPGANTYNGFTMSYNRFL